MIIRDSDTTREIKLKSFAGFYDVFEAILDCEVAYLKRPFIFPFREQALGLKPKDNGLPQDHRNKDDLKDDPQNLEVHNEGTREHRKGESGSELVSAPKIRRDSTRPQYRCGENSIRQPSSRIENLARLDQLTFRGVEIISTWYKEPDPGTYRDMAQQMLTSTIGRLLSKSPKSVPRVMALKQQIWEELKPPRESMEGKHDKNSTLLTMEDEVHVHYSSPVLETTIDEVREPCGKKRWITTIWL